jgi:hypothetical protein
MNRRAFRAPLLAAGLVLAALPGLAETRIEKDLKLSPGGDFRLETDMGSVVVAGSPDAGAHIVITSKRKDLEELLTFRFEEGAASASVVARKKHPMSSWFSDHGGSVHYEIRVPAETRLSINTSGGSIKVGGMRLPAKLDTSGGSINVNDLVGDLDADTSGGSIDLKDIKGRVRVETSGGGIEAVSIDGPVHAQSSGGSIELQKVTGDIDAETSGGGIRIVDAGGRVRGDTSGGSMLRSTPRRIWRSTLPAARSRRNCRSRSAARSPAAASRARSARAATRCACARAGARSGSRRCRRQNGGR